MITSVADLDERLAQPSPGLVSGLRRLDGDIVVLGAAGKLGPGLVHLALNAIAAAGSQATVTVGDLIARYGTALPAQASSTRSTGSGGTTPCSAMTSSLRRTLTADCPDPRGCGACHPMRKESTASASISTPRPGPLGG